MIKTLKDFRKELDSMMKERGYNTKRHVQEHTCADAILVNSANTVVETSIGAIFIPQKSGRKTKALKGS